LSSEAFGIVLAMVGTVLAICSWLGVGLKNTITYQYWKINGVLPVEVAENEIDTIIALLKSELFAVRFDFHNRGVRHLIDTKIRLEFYKSPFSYRIEDCKNIDGKSMSLSTDKETILIAIPDFPAGAKFSIHTIGRNSPIYPKAIGSGPNFKIKDDEGFKTGRAFKMAMVVVFLLIVANIALVAFGNPS
jgi:hypothetical protein